MGKVGSENSHLSALSGRPARISDSMEDEEADRVFQQISRRITADFHARSLRRASSPEIRPMPWLEAVCYELVKDVIDSDHVGVFERRVEKYGRGKRGPKGNLFQMAILAIFAEASLTDVRAQARERLGKRLWYAYRHYVPPCFLQGFLLQVCDREFFKRATQDMIEPDFVKWVVKARATSKDPYPMRGSYPAAIEKAVRKIETRGYNQRE